MDTTSLPRINDNLPTKRHGGAEEANNYKFLYINNNYGWTTMQWEREALHGLEGGGEWVHGRIWNWYENRRTYQSIVMIGGLRDSMVAKGWDHN